jgi:hypothetical protein
VENPAVAVIEIEEKLICLTPELDAVNDEQGFPIFERLRLDAFDTLPDVLL